MNKESMEWVLQLGATQALTLLVLAVLVFVFRSWIAEVIKGLGAERLEQFKREQAESLEGSKRAEAETLTEFKADRDRELAVLEHRLRGELAHQSRSLEFALSAKHRRLERFEENREAVCVELVVSMSRTMAFVRESIRMRIEGEAPRGQATRKQVEACEAQVEKCRLYIDQECFKRCGQFLWCCWVTATFDQVSDPRAHATELFKRFTQTIDELRRLVGGEAWVPEACRPDNTCVHAAGATGVHWNDEATTRSGCMS